MYSREDKIAIMTVFYQSGMTKAEASRHPGFPASSMIHRWDKEVREGRLPVPIPDRPTYMPHARSDDATKREAMRLMDAGLRPVDVARKLGLAAGNVSAWRRKARKGKLFGAKVGGDRRTPEQKEAAMAKRGTVGPGSYDDPILENQVLRAVLADLKAGGSLDPLISNRRKVELGERLRRAYGFPLRAITSSLRISKSTYEYHRRRLGHDRYAWLRPLVRRAFDVRGGRFGYRTVHADLRRDGVRVSEKVVRRVMHEQGLEVRYLGRPRRTWSSYAGETAVAPPNLVMRDFHAGLPNFLWLTDITEFRLPSFRCYLSPVIDCFDGRVVAHRLSLHPDAALANSMLEDACSTLARGEAPVIHDDRGAHYRWPGWVSICERHGLTRSMSSKGCCPDNSAMEGFFGRLKQEFFYHRCWSGITFDEFARELDDYILWYNGERPKKSLGWMSPDEFRESLGLA